MEYFDSNILCLTYEELVPQIMSKPVYDQQKWKSKLKVYGIGGNGRRVLIEFESLPIKYKHKVRSHYGDPYQYASKQPILDSLVWDNEAEKFYNSYTLPTGDKLPSSGKDLNGKDQINYVHRYTENATWLNMLGRLTADKATLKKELGISIMTFWDTASQMIKIKCVDLPKNPKRLKERLKIYQSENGGYESLIDLHKFGNSHSKKIDEEYLKALLKQRNQHDDTIIAEVYNEWAKEQEKKTIDPAAVGYWRRKWGAYLLKYTGGEGEAKAKLKKKISRKRASAPLLFINSDDNVWDVYFYKPETVVVRNGKRKVIPENKWFTLSLYVVFDTFNDLPIGYAAGHSVTVDLIKDAYRDAARYVKKMTGDNYLWQQIQTDRWSLNKDQSTPLGEFYKSMSVSTPAQLKNPFSKYVERAFGTTWHQNLKRLFPDSYSGHNIKAKQSLSTDTLNPKNFPHINEAPMMVYQFIQSLRNSKRKGCELTREQEWLKAFNESEKSKKKLLTPAMYLETFGKRHLPKNGQLNQIDDFGLRPTLLGEKRHYELSQAQILQHIGKRVQVIYDEKDLSQVLITDGKGLRLMATEFDKTPSALADYEDGDASRIKKLQAEGNALLPMIEEWAGDEDGRLLSQATARIKAGVLTKELSHEDHRIAIAARNGAVLETSFEEVKEDIKPSKKVKEASIWDLM